MAEGKTISTHIIHEGNVSNVYIQGNLFNVNMVGVRVTSDNKVEYGVVEGLDSMEYVPTSSFPSGIYKPRAPTPLSEPTVPSVVHLHLHLLLCRHPL